MSTSIRSTRTRGNREPQYFQRVADLALSCRVATRNGETVVAYLMRVLEDDEESTANRLSAAQILLDRGYGKAPQQVALDSGNEDRELVAGLTTDHLRTLVALLDRLPAEVVQRMAETGELPLSSGA